MSSSIEDRFHRVVLTKEQAHSEFRELCRLLFANYTSLVVTMENLCRVIQKSSNDEAKKLLDENLEMIKEASNLNMRNLHTGMNNLFEANEVLLQFIAETNGFTQNPSDGHLLN